MQRVTPYLTIDGRRLMHAEMTVNGGRIMLSDAFPEHRHCGPAEGAPRVVSIAPALDWPGHPDLRHAIAPVEQLARVVPELRPLFAQVVEDERIEHLQNVWHAV